MPPFHAYDHKDAAELLHTDARGREKGGYVLSLWAEFRQPRQQVVAQVVTLFRESGQPVVEVGRRVVFRVVGFRLPGGRPREGFRLRFGHRYFFDKIGRASCRERVSSPV